MRIVCAVCGRPITVVGGAADHICNPDPTRELVRQELRAAGIDPDKLKENLIYTMAKRLRETTAALARVRQYANETKHDYLLAILDRKGKP
jgi:hypothetical protein